MNIEFNCRECGQLIAIDSKYTGTNVQCPQCKAEITVPKPEFATIEQQRTEKKIDKELKGAQGGTPKQAIWSKEWWRARIMDSEVSSEDKIRPECGAVLSEGEEEIEDALVERYPALRFIAGCYTFLAWLFAILAIIGGLIGIYNSRTDLTEKVAIGSPVLCISVIGGIIGFLGFLSCS